MSERPPIQSGEDMRHLDLSDRATNVRSVTGRAEADLHPNTATREIALRLRPTALPPTVALAGRHLVLASLLDAPTSALRLRLTYALRKNAPFEVAIQLQLDAARDGVCAQRTAKTTKRSIEGVCRVVFPGMAAVAPSAPRFEGPRLALQPPGFDAVGQTAAPARSLRPQLARSDTTEALYLPHHGAPDFALDSALVGLTEAGIEADLAVDIANVDLAAEHIRALASAQQHLVAATYAEDYGDRARAKLAEVEAWLQVRQPILCIEMSLRFSGQPDPAATRLAESLLFGVPSVGGGPRPPGLDLSSCVRVGAPIPNMVVHPITLAAIAEAARHRRSRALRGDVVPLGTDELGRAVTVQADDLRQHLYIIGQTGVGKSTMLRNIALADAHADRPFVMIDPHGDLHAEVLEALPRSLRSHAIVADAGDFAAPFSLNILQVMGPYAAIQRNFIANQLIGLFKSIYGHNADAFGPMFEAYFRAALFLLMDAGGPDASLLELERVFGDGPYRRGLLEKCADPTVTSFWRNIALKAGGEASLENIAPYITSKLSQLAGNPLLRPILCTPHTTLDLPRALADGRPVLINLAKGLTGSDAGILGGIITIRLFAAGMERARLAPAERRLTRVILDEFQTYGAVNILAEALAEVRKYGLSIVLANQSIAQVDGRSGDVAHAILGNTGNLAVFRVGPRDAALLAEWLGPEVSASTLLRLPNHTSVARLLRAGEPTPPVTFRTDARHERG